MYPAPALPLLLQPIPRFHPLAYFSLSAHHPGWPQVSHTITTDCGNPVISLALIRGNFSTLAAKHGNSRVNPCSPTDLSIAQKVFAARKSLHSLSSVFPTDYKHLSAFLDEVKHFDERRFSGGPKETTESN